MTMPETTESWTETAARRPPAADDVAEQERELVGMIIHRPELVEHAIEDVTTDDFFDPLNARIFGLAASGTPSLLNAIAPHKGEILCSETGLTLGGYVAQLAAETYPPGEDATVQVRQLAAAIRAAADFERSIPEADYTPDAEADESEQRAILSGDLLPLIMLDATLWQNQPVKPQGWLVRHRIPAGNVGLMSGDGAAGKTTIMLQLAVATVLGTDWLGALIEASGPVIFFSAEEDSDEIHRRLDAILAGLGLSFSDLGHCLHVVCTPGQDSVLGKPDRSGIIQPTKLFRQLELSVANIGPALVVIEAAADVFAGNENDRSQVRQFIGLLRRLTLPSAAAVSLIQHPSLTGLASGTGTSGSTGWNNSVRSRMNFTAVKPRDGDDADPDLRQLRVMKSNYGPAGETIALRWQRGRFVPAGSGSTLERITAESAIDEAFLRCLDARSAQKIPVGPHRGVNYAPSVFEKMPEAGGFRKQALTAALERLLSTGRVTATTVGSPTRQRTILVRKEQNL